MKRQSRSTLTLQRGIVLLLVIFAAAGIYLRAGRPASTQLADHTGSLKSDAATDATASPATIKVYTGTLTGAAEVPPVATAGTGTVTVTVNTAASTMRLQVTFSGLTGNVTASHIHCCAPVGTNVGVATTTPSFSGFPSGVTSGTYDNTFDMTLASSYNSTYITANGGTPLTARDALFAGLNSGQSYLNIHTSFAGGGEIRAQLMPPSTVVRSAAGPAAVDVTAARDAFRADLGGGVVAGANGSFGGLRREINWDGVPDASAAPSNLAANFFNVNSPRGVVFSTPGTGFQVSATVASGTPVNFGNINPAYAATFAPFSAQRLFTSVGSNTVDVNFFGPGTTTPALVRGFGAIFSDVDTAGSTTVTLFDRDNISLGTFVVPAQAGTATFSFLGVSFGSAIVSRVRIVSGNAALGAATNDGGGTDVVVLDDFLYGEPAAIPTAAGVTVSGRILSPEGRGVRGASVSLTDMSGETRTVPAGGRGTFIFDDVAVGETYVVSVRSRRYNFEPMVITVNETLSDLLFSPGGPGSSRR